MGAGAAGALGMVSPAIGVAGGIYSAISGAKEKRDADKSLANYNRQELKNIAENLQASTRGAEVQTANQARLEANQIDALRGGGTRALVAGLGRVEAGSQAVAEDIGINLDEQQMNISQMKAQDDARIRAMQENREIADIAALSSQSQAGKDAMMMGFGNIIQGGGEIGAKAVTPEGSERRQAWRDFKSANPDANRSDFMNSYRQGNMPLTTRRNTFGIGAFPSNIDYNVAP